jgi:YHS domain-containing protein
MARAKDPVCGMTVDTDRPPAKGTYDGQTVYFCSEHCRTTFESRRKAR